MSYLFGDSTPSTLEIDYIQFLRDAFDCCIDILRADERIAQGKVWLEALEKAAAVNLEHVQKVAALVPKAFDGAALGEPESPAARCASAILRSAAALAAATVADVKGSVEVRGHARLGLRDVAALDHREQVAVFLAHRGR